MSPQPKHFRIVHEIRRRIRIASPVIHRDEERAFILEILLRKKGEITEARAIPAIGGLVVRFDPGALPKKNLLILLDAVLGNLAMKKGAVARTAAKQPAPDGPCHEIQVAVEEMTCASCSLLIELALNRDPLVKKATVNFASETPVVEVWLDRDALHQRIARLGYLARPLHTPTHRPLVVPRRHVPLQNTRNSLH